MLHTSTCTVYSRLAYTFYRPCSTLYGSVADWHRNCESKRRNWTIKNYKHTKNVRSTITLPPEMLCYTKQVGMGSKRAHWLQRSKNQTMFKRVSIATVEHTHMILAAKQLYTRAGRYIFRHCYTPFCDQTQPPYLHNRSNGRWLVRLYMWVCIRSDKRIICLYGLNSLVGRYALCFNFMKYTQTVDRYHRTLWSVHWGLCNCVSVCVVWTTISICECECVDHNSRGKSIGVKLMGKSMEIDAAKSMDEHWVRCSKYNVHAVENCIE